MKLISLKNMVDKKNISNTLLELLIPKSMQKEIKVQVKDNICYIYTKDQIYMTEILLLKRQMLEIAKKYKNDIKDIVVRVNAKLFFEKEVVVDIKQREYDQILKEKKEEANKIFEDIEDEKKRKYLTTLLALSKLKEYYSKKNKEKKCKICSEYFQGSNDTCIICINEKKAYEKKIIKSLLLKNTLLSKEYIVNILSYSELAYLEARDEILKEIYLKMVEKYKKKKNYSKELEDYIEIKLGKISDFVKNMEKKKINERLRKILMEK
ncbi:hypothetical protein [Sneathia sanguinegens]|uniref:hypothetical protein n=1 Tax=Sneathia sanguinegens TaxID=40543 RepID=UPI0023F73F52|nr:hypothetical protein [Sneathia sanguinegens]